MKCRHLDICLKVMGVLGWRLQKCVSCPLYRWYANHRLDGSKRRKKDPALTSGARWRSWLLRTRAALAEYGVEA